MTDEEIIEETEKIAAAIDAVCQGRQSALVFLAVSWMIGRFAAQAENPDFHGTIKLVSEGAFYAFREKMQERRNG